MTLILQIVGNCVTADKPKPYVWTKTADEILERLAGYLKRIPDSGH